MKKKIDIDKKNGLVTVTIELPKRNSANDPILNFWTGDVRTLLESEGVSFGACRKKDSLSNHGDSDTRKGTWVFAIKKEQSAPPKRTSSRKTEQNSKNQSLTSESKPAKIDNKRSNSSSNQRKVVE